MLEWDTSASFELTPFDAKFVDYAECYIPVNYVTKVNKVI